MLMVPVGRSALDESRVDETAAALRAQNILADRLQVPFIVDFLDEVGQELDWVRRVGQRRLARAGSARGSR